MKNCLIEPYISPMNGLTPPPTNWCGRSSGTWYSLGITRCPNMPGQRITDTLSPGPIGMRSSFGSGFQGFRGSVMGHLFLLLDVGEFRPFKIGPDFPVICWPQITARHLAFSGNLNRQAPLDRSEEH